MRLLYVMDPMCAWCYGFQPELEDFLATVTPVRLDLIMGGLAPDDNQPMSEDLRDRISSFWYEIEDRSRASFNHGYWEHNTPYRSTYNACRAVLAAESIQQGHAQKMVIAIQQAYYQQAKNPSLEPTLIDCAVAAGLDKDAFLVALRARDTEMRLQEHLALTRQLKVKGFPALFFINSKKHAFPIALGFERACELSKAFQAVTEKLIESDML